MISSIETRSRTALMLASLMRPATRSSLHSPPGKDAIDALAAIGKSTADETPWRFLGGLDQSVSGSAVEPLPTSRACQRTAERSVHRAPWPTTGPGRPAVPL